MVLKKKALTNEIAQEYKREFDIIDKKSTGKIPVTEVPFLMRKVGLMPSNLEVDELIAEVDKEKKSILEGISFEQFCEIAANKIDDVYTYTDIINAFQVFDLTKKGYVPSAYLKEALSNLGESLTVEEMNAFLRTDAIDEEGNLHYEQFVQKMSTSR